MILTEAPFPFNSGKYPLWVIATLKLTAWLKLIKNLHIYIYILFLPWALFLFSNVRVGTEFVVWEQAFSTSSKSSLIHWRMIKNSKGAWSNINKDSDTLCPLYQIWILIFEYCILINFAILFNIYIDCYLLNKYFNINDGLGIIPPNHGTTLDNQKRGPLHQKENSKTTATL